MIHNTSTSQKIFSLQESIYQDYHEILMCCCANSGFTLFSVATPSRPKNLWVDTAADDKSRKRKQPATVPKCTVSGWRKLRKYNNLAWHKSPSKYNTKYQISIPSAFKHNNLGINRNPRNSFHLLRAWCTVQIAQVRKSGNKPTNLRNSFYLLQFLQVSRTDLGSWWWCCWLLGPELLNDFDLGFVSFRVSLSVFF